MITCMCSQDWVKRIVKGHSFRLHEPGCINRALGELDRELREKVAWERQDQPCSGPGYSHKSHGKCPGYSTDRT